MDNQQPTASSAEVNKQQQLSSEEELLFVPVEGFRKLQIDRMNRVSSLEMLRRGRKNPFRLSNKSLTNKTMHRRSLWVPSSLYSTSQSTPESSSSSVRSYKKHYGRGRNSIIREAVLRLHRGGPACLSDNSASTLLEKACKLSISNKTTTFGDGSVTKDFQSLNISSTPRVVKDDAVLPESYESNSFQRARSNTMPSSLKRPTTAEASSSSNGHTCSVQARISPPPCDVTIDELASYFEEFVHIPKKMSHMAEMMYI